MAKRTDIKKVLVIGSGPIVIGQAAEFDYAGTQACIALKEEGYQVILANSNPATIMGCTCETNFGPKRVCRDGPVFRKEEILWQKRL